MCLDFVSADGQLRLVLIVHAIAAHADALLQRAGAMTGRSKTPEFLEGLLLWRLIKRRRLWVKDAPIWRHGYSSLIITVMMAQ